MAIKPYVQDVTYEQYCVALAHIANPAEVAITLPGPLLKWIGEAKEVFTQIAELVHVALQDVIGLFMQRDIFGLLKAVAFNMGKILHALTKVTALIPKGLVHVMEEIAKSGAVQKIQSGAMSVDEFLNKYPLLKKLAGIGVAGLLLYIWLNMAFVGDLHFDMNIETVILAFKGHFSLHDLFTSPTGLAMVALFAVGFTGMSFPWLADSMMNLIMALAYTGAIKLKKTPVAQHFKKHLALKRY